MLLMAPLLVLVLGGIALPLVPRRVRWTVPIVVLSVELALVVRALTGEPALVVGAAVAGALAGLLVREIIATFSLLSTPAQDARPERDRVRGRRATHPATRIVSYAARSANGGAGSPPDIPEPAGVRPTPVLPFAAWPSCSPSG